MGRSLDKSKAWWKRAEKVLAGGAATLSKNPDRFAQGVTPLVLTHGKRGAVWDVDGNKYLDTIGALGPVILGYDDPQVYAAVISQARQGVSFSLPHVLEIEVAEILVDAIPSCEMIRFGKNGADATQAAVRLARHVTGKQHIICSGYHGGHDWYMASTDKANGILPQVKEYTHQCRWQDGAQFDELCDLTDRDLAAIIVEIPPPVWGTDHVQDYFDWLVSLQRHAHDTGAVFILDEVVTGFRYGIGGAQAFYGIVPDLTCLGKAMANGYPLAALGGRRDLMQHFANGEVFFSTTYGGEAVSLAAARATLLKLHAPSVLRDLHYAGELLGMRLAKLLEDTGMPATLTGTPGRLVLTWHDTAQAKANIYKTLWLAGTIAQGVLHGGPLFPMACWRDADVDLIMRGARMTCETIAAYMATDTLEAALGEIPPIQDVFGQRYVQKEQYVKS